MPRELRYFEAVREATELCMEKDPSVTIMGLGVPDPKGIFGTTLGLRERFGDARVMDTPSSENAMTGIAIGNALLGMRPILTHQRTDFALLSIEQIVNQAAKWRYMFGGEGKLPIVIRLMVGRGWGQGPQHSQALHAWLAHIPGLKVVQPATPYDAKGLLISAIEDDNPVVFIEHRWLHPVSGKVPKGMYRVPIGPSSVLREGNDITIAASSYMTLEALRAAEWLAHDGIGAEVVDLPTLRPLDDTAVLESVRKTGRFIAADLAWPQCGLASEMIARVSQKVFASLKSAPRSLTMPDAPTPTSHALADHYYPTSSDLAALARQMLGRSEEKKRPREAATVPLDVPEKNFAGAF